MRTDHERYINRERKARQLNASLNKYKDSSFLRASRDNELFEISKNSSPIVVSVSGAPGTGKTTLAYELAGAFQQVWR